MLSNVWVHEKLAEQLNDVFPKKRRLDLLPAICDKKQGIAMVSLSEDDMKKILHKFERGIVINASGGAIANICNTTIVIDVVSICPIGE